MKGTVGTVKAQAVGRSAICRVSRTSFLSQTSAPRSAAMRNLQVHVPQSLPVTANLLELAVGRHSLLGHACHKFATIVSRP